MEFKNKASGIHDGLKNKDSAQDTRLGSLEVNYQVMFNKTLSDFAVSCHRQLRVFLVVNIIEIGREKLCKSDSPFPSSFHSGCSFCLRGSHHCRQVCQA